MSRDRISDVQIFLAVARERSFSRAATKMGLSPSSLSHTIRALEGSLGVQLLTRTTRSVAATEAGERLIQSVGPRLAEVDAELDAVGEFAIKPKGTVRITATDYGVNEVIWPRLAKVLRDNADLKVEVIVDYGLTNVVAERYDLGVRNGDQVEKDMVAVRIGPDRRMVIVGTPDYFEQFPEPRKPDDLLGHNCISLRFASGGLYAWELKKGKRETQVRVEGQAIFNGGYQVLNAALSGCGLAFVPEDMAAPHVVAGRLRYTMEDWFPTIPGLHIYYPSARQRSRAVQLVVDSLRYRR
ncbi:LysR family transcriptional regulator [Bordetella sp. N]|uniref:LysR family transcriptional regulator n=1 Tax=Bordetella sp. N TaxID=1746199 RepID=UPI00070C5564|nr:LysR family transcriptional regulator [Bordetella sp. N]ALM84226.1 LysR family transcriptional regulator [Bordetella sp. N]